ncbi:MAG TPA: CaiB/BaiF CoA-transferase family protein [Thermodesulfobacteriota bacterium]|nr:CaiB/BaiF CoA-transferase family protein [Thermodesulfobacteriota bacterium]
MTMTGHPLPLSGIRVLELSHAVMGPTCGVILADMGAEVIKVERAPDGDETRRLKGFGLGFLPFLNRNKKSIAIDLKSDRGKAVLEKLILSADVLLENFAPGTIERLGFGWERLSALNPRLIYCALKGFMPGPYEKRPALDEVVQMMAGLAYMTGPLGQPLRAGASVVDIVGGMNGVIAILTALYERKTTGRGKPVIATLYESTAFLMGQHMAVSALTGKPSPPMPNRVSAWSVYDRFETMEGEMVFVGVTSDRHWKRFCDVFGLAALGQDTRLSTNNDRVAQRSWLIPELQKVFRALPKEKLFRLCAEAEIPFSPIAKPEDLFEDPQMNEGGGLLETTLPGGVKTKLPRIPLRIGSYDFGMRSDPPKVGEHSGDILESIGFSPAEIEELRRDKNIVG